MTIVYMNDIVKRYGSFRALDHVDLEIEEGTIMGLLGPNGAGKTTLIHSLAGLIKIDSGEVYLFGKKLNENIMEVKQQIGLVTQEVTVFEDLTARENLEFFGGIYGLRGTELKQRVDETLAFVGLTDRAKSLPTKFSGGMKRRLNIACALVHRPKLLIMDEPTVGIDPQSRNYILDSVRKLQQQGTTILYTTHYMEEVQSIASQIAIMDRGHVIAKGTLDELIENIQHEERIELEVVNDPTRELLAELENLDGVKLVSQESKNIQVVSGGGAENVDNVLAIIQKAGGVRSVTAKKPTLEDVFLTLTGKTLRDGEEG
ncbi:ABC transporter ATP-binding protein [Oceanobacillus jeddahense]|uniref:ABC transporter ATP-binding protein n=1 Tax=Oceanobacillus jeddahense TaxID=1462527 RepID=A0ABY5JM57_9BACI|nr:ABC transporter ATP-binding protein [Oceanobacillus jeddahense]UUI01385.1 ABC transporter ATP-binding protein [Oceanobacillus jeddahense]